MSKIKNFTAKVHSGSAGFLIEVKGDVNCGKLEVEPQLIEAKPQGINPRILILDVFPASDDETGSFRKTQFNKNLTSQKQYSSVELRDSKGNSMETIPLK